MARRRSLAWTTALVLGCAPHEPPPLAEKFVENPRQLMLAKLLPWGSSDASRPHRGLLEMKGLDGKRGTSRYCRKQPPTPRRLCAWLGRDDLDIPGLRAAIGRYARRVSHDAAHMLVSTDKLLDGGDTVLRYEWEHLSAGAGDCVWRLRRRADQGLLLELWPAADCT